MEDGFCVVVSWFAKELEDEKKKTDRWGWGWGKGFRDRERSLCCPTYFCRGAGRREEIRRTDDRGEGGGGMEDGFCFIASYFHVSCPEETRYDGFFCVQAVPKSKNLSLIHI